MSIALADFWKLLKESRLLAPEQVDSLIADFASVKGGGEQGNSRTVAEWLVSRNVLSRYQTTILLAGRAGPFYYGDYKVYDRVDKGRMAGWFRAVHAPTGHPVMLEFLTGAVTQDPRSWAIAANHALGATSLASPHLHRLHEPVDLKAFKFLVLEDTRGGTLEERLAVGRFPPAEACRIARLAALALATLHQAGRVHGDVRPANFILEQSGNVKLLSEPHVTPASINFADPQIVSALQSKADYLAPELLQPGKTPDPLCDIYSLGCVLYAMLTGTPPFAGGNAQQKMTRHASEAIRPLDQFGVPPQVAQLVTYMMAKNPQVRYQSAAIVAEQLAQLVDPQTLYWQPPAPLPTLAHFEQHVAHKQQQLRAQAQTATAKPAAAGINLNLSGTSPAGGAPASLGFSTGPSAGSVPRSSVSAEMVAAAKAKKQQQMLIGGLVGTGILAIAILIGVSMMGGGDPATDPVAENGTGTTENGGETKTPTTNPDPATAVPAATPVVNPGTTPVEAPPTPSGSKTEPTTVVQTVVPDDGQLLWASPTSGEPISLRMVPPEAQVFIAVRPAELKGSAEGQLVLNALGPEFSSQSEAFERAAGVKLDEIEQLIIGLHNNDAKFPRVSYVVKLKSPIPREELLTRWGNPTGTTEGTEAYFTGASGSYFLSSDPQDEGKFLMASQADVQEVAKVKGAPPLLFLEMEKLRRTTDSTRHFTLLVYPPFLFNDDGEPLFAGERGKVRQPLSWLLGDGLKSASVSGHFGNEFYFEMQFLGSLDKEKFQLAKDFRTRLEQIPRSLEDYFVALTPPPYWKKLSFRYPQMITTLHNQMRVGVENEQAMVNAVLPLHAAHNLVLGGELLIATAPGAAVVAANTPAAGAAPKTIEDVLNLKTSFAFDQTSLEFAMRDLAAETRDLAKGLPFEFDIQILGDDLKFDGITRNQSIRDFKQEGKAVGEILTALVMKANPITTVKEPNELDQKLIWVVHTSPDDPNKPMILITTRAKAAEKKYTLPATFQPK